MKKSRGTRIIEFKSRPGGLACLSSPPHSVRAAQRIRLSSLAGALRSSSASARQNSHTNAPRDSISSRTRQSTPKRRFVSRDGWNANTVSDARMEHILGAEKFNASSPSRPLDCKPAAAWLRRTKPSLKLPEDGRISCGPSSAAALNSALELAGASRGNRATRDGQPAWRGCWLRALDSRRRRSRPPISPRSGPWLGSSLIIRCPWAAGHGL